MALPVCESIFGLLVLGFMGARLATGITGGRGAVLWTESGVSAFACMLDRGFRIEFELLKLVTIAGEMVFGLYASDGATLLPAPCTVALFRWDRSCRLIWLSLRLSFDWLPNWFDFNLTRFTDTESSIRTAEWDDTVAATLPVQILKNKKGTK